MIIYSKFNLHRKKEFQLLTTIESDNNFLFSAKTSQRKESENFLNSFFSKYENISAANLSIAPVKPQKISDTKVVFEYKNGISLDSLLLDAVIKKDKNKFLGFIEYYLNSIKDNEMTERTFSEDFEKIFGACPKKKNAYLQIGCLDLNFDNIIHDEKSGKCCLIDYEWTFDFAVPYKYVVFRALSNFYFRYYSYNLNKFIDISGLYKLAEISDDEKELFTRFEYNFQDYVNENFEAVFGGFEKFRKNYFESLEKKEIVKNDSLQRKDQTIQQKDSEIQQKDQAIQQKVVELQQKDQAIQQKNQTIELEEHLIQQKDSELQKKDAEITMMKSSKFWKLRDRYIRIKSVRPKHIASLAKKGYDVFEKKGTKAFFWSFYKYILHGRGYFKTKPQLEKTKTDYEIWMEKNEKWDKEKIEEKIKNFKYKPKISIVTPVYSVDPKWLNRCIESVRNQFYENWELCLYDDASTKEETIKCLKKWQKKGEYRIKISFGKENQHISGASNEALKLATGEFIALLDNDDELAPIALYENVKLLNEHPEADFIYSDEDKIDEKRNRVEPYFKPDWSPDLFLFQMYTCHLGTYRKSIIDEIGGFRKGFEGSQDYDLVLRFIEKTSREKIFHIPKILYHWRKIAGSMAGKETAKDYTSVSAGKALKDYLKRNKIEGEVLDGKFPGTYHVKRKILGNPKVSIIIPFKDQADALKVCINSILEKTHYKNYEIILVDNQSKEQKTFDYLESVKNNSVIRILHFDKPFNFSAINNFAVRKADGEYILFLNNDIEVISEGWLSSLLEQAQRKEIGAVGAKLLYPNDTIQHAGVVMGLGVAGHAFKYFPADKYGYFSHLHLIKNYCCVTAACLMMKKKLFEEIGGFDENNLAIAFNDVDLCLRLFEKGYYNIWTPYTELYHHESLSRGDDGDKNLKQKDPEKYKRVKAENDYMKKKWAKYIKNDPFYSPNLTKTREDFGLRLE